MITYHIDFQLLNRKREHYNGKITQYIKEQLNKEKNQEVTIEG